MGNETLLIRNMNSNRIGVRRTTEEMALQGSATSEKALSLVTSCFNYMDRGTEMGFKG